MKLIKRFKSPSGTVQRSYETLSSALPMRSITRTKVDVSNLIKTGDFSLFPYSRYSLGEGKYLNFKDKADQDKYISGLKSGEYNSNNLYTIPSGYGKYFFYSPEYDEGTAEYTAAVEKYGKDHPYFYVRRGKNNNALTENWSYITSELAAQNAQNLRTELETKLLELNQKDANLSNFAKNIKLWASEHPEGAKIVKNVGDGVLDFITSVTLGTPEQLLEARKHYTPEQVKAAEDVQKAAAGGYAAIAALNPATWSVLADLYSASGGALKNMWDFGKTAVNYSKPYVKNAANAIEEYLPSWGKIGRYVDSTKGLNLTGQPGVWETAGTYADGASSAYAMALASTNAANNIANGEWDKALGNTVNAASYGNGKLADFLNVGLFFYDKIMGVDSADPVNSFGLAGKIIPGGSLIKSGVNILKDV